MRTPRAIARRHRWPFTARSQWVWRWMYSDHGARLHRVVEFQPAHRDATHGRARTACDRSGIYAMPGVLSRMGMQRCRACCKRAGIPLGDGAPYNSKIDG